ncbi:alpha/beta fold hydrolase [uncultured Mucilaginibacter sp.]|uniref:alpha/beta hydrolase n=1 Tax=uncultured Mucilaginibacter sp. TaxID=797541 RepID=UPI0025EE8A91|nr:alpha/beta fold hydrolase [uncultured Mucilaginibacter sp.]
MKKLLFILALILSLPQVYAQAAEPGIYRIALSKFTLYYNRNQPDSIFNMFAADVKKDLPMLKNREMISELQVRSGRLQRATFTTLNEGIATYRADFQRAVLSMQISINGAGKIGGLLFDNYRGQNIVKPVDDPYTTETPLELKTLSGAIRGTLAMPKQASGKVPVVLIIPSSGPTDRDGNKLKLNQQPDTYKLIAFALAKNGIASLRYDKRLTGEVITPAKETQLRFDDYIDDAVMLAGALREDERFSKVVLLGHSEGSLVGMLAAVSQPVNGFISVEGESLPGDKLMSEQLKNQPDYITKGFKQITDSLRRGKTYDKVDPSLYSIARVSVQPYLMTWMRFDPVKEIKKVKAPTLIIQGTTDLQVSAADAERLKKGKSDAKVVMIPGMNYVLKEAPAAQAANLATYNQSGLPVKPELVSAITDFVKSIK